MSEKHLPNLFKYDDYKHFLRATLDATRRRGARTELALEAGCQRSYLSAVLTSHVQLTPEHAYKLCRFWRFDATETRYFLLLVEHARSGSKEHRSYLEGLLSDLRGSRDEIASRVKQPGFDDAARAAHYYSDWRNAAVHLLTGIPGLNSARAIAARLGIPTAEAARTLHLLEGLGLVRKDGSEWTCGAGSVHVSKDSPLFQLHRANWNARATDALQARRGGVHFTGVYSLSAKDAADLRERILEMIAAIQKTVEPSREEDVFCFSCDWFPI